MNGMIQSDNYYIWDNWGFVSEEGILHIYAQFCEKDLCTLPEDRYWNVHIEHFISCDHGATFEKCGPVIEKSTDPQMFDSYNIWSGSTFPLKSGKVLGFYTGLQLPGEPLPEQRKFALQSIGLAVSGDGGYTFTKLQEPLISPIRDYELLIGKGYFLGPKKTLGAIDDPDGTFMCLRDPEVFQEGDTIHIIFGAKAVKSVDGKAELRNAVGHAIIRDVDNPESIELQEPIFIANEKDYNQLELPNLIRWNDMYYLVISTTRYEYFGQTDMETEKTVRVYTSGKLADGEWEPCGGEGRHIILSNKADNLYGPKLIHQQEKGGVFHFRPFVVGETYAPPTIGIDLRGRVPKVIYQDCLMGE